MLDRLEIEAEYEVGTMVRHNVKPAWTGVVTGHASAGWCLVDWDNDNMPPRRAVNIARAAV